VDVFDDCVLQVYIMCALDVRVVYRYDTAIEINMVGVLDCNLVCRL